MTLKLGRDGFLDPAQVDSAFKSINAARSGQHHSFSRPPRQARNSTPSRSLYFSMACGIALVVMVIWGDDYAMSLLHRHVIDPIHDHVERRVAHGHSGVVDATAARAQKPQLSHHRERAVPWPPHDVIHERRNIDSLHDKSVWPPVGQHVSQKTAVPPALRHPRLPSHAHASEYGTPQRHPNAAMHGRSPRARGVKKIKRARKNRAGALGHVRIPGQRRRAVKQGVAGLNLCPPGHFIHARHIRGGLRTSCMLCPVGYVRPMDLDPRRCTKCGPKRRSSPDRLKCILTTRDVTVTASPQSTGVQTTTTTLSKAQLPRRSQPVQQKVPLSTTSARTSTASVTKAQAARQTQQLKAQAVAVSARTSATPIAQRKPAYTCISGKCTVNPSGAGIALNLCLSICQVQASAPIAKFQASSTAVPPDAVRPTTVAPSVAGAKPQRRAQQPQPLQSNGAAAATKALQYFANHRSPQFSSITAAGQLSHHGHYDGPPETN